MNLIRMLGLLLSPREKRNLVLLFIAVLGTAIAETGGVGAVLPFVSLATNPSIVTEGGRYGYVYNLFGAPPFGQFLLIVGVIVIGILVLGNAFSALTQYGIIRFSTMRGYSISRRLFQEYLSRPYDFYLASNTAGLSRNILDEIRALVLNLLMPILEMVSRGFVSLCIVVFLIVLNPLVAAAVIAILGSMYGTVIFLTGKKLRRLGRERLVANTGRFKTTNEAFSSIKDVKLFHSESYFDRVFAVHARNYARKDAASSIIGQLPRYALEAIAFSCVVLLVLVSAQSRSGFTQAVPFLAAYAVASYKLMPALQIILRNVSRIRYAIPSLQVVTGDLKGAPVSVQAVPERSLPMATIRFQNVSFNYSERVEAAVRDVSLEIEPNTSIGIVGETGSGKTTIVDLLIGLLYPQSGSISIGDVRLNQETAREWQTQLGYVPQMISLLDDTVARNIAFGIDPAEVDMGAVREAAAIARIDSFIENELPSGYGTELGERGVRISGGQRQRIGIARALYRNPQVLIFDEATSALDNLTEQAVMDAIQSIGHTKTTIMIAHRISTVRDCDKIVVMDRGRIAGIGTYDELIAQNETFRSIAQKR